MPGRLADVLEKPLDGEGSPLVAHERGEVQPRDQAFGPACGVEHVPEIGEIPLIWLHRAPAGPEGSPCADTGSSGPLAGPGPRGDSRTPPRSRAASRGNRIARSGFRVRTRREGPRRWSNSSSCEPPSRRGSACGHRTCGTGAPGTPWTLRVPNRV